MLLQYGFWLRFYVQQKLIPFVKEASFFKEYPVKLATNHFTRTFIFEP
jgi:hypothetical protein